MTVQKAKRNTTTAIVEVWKNLIIFHAGSEKDAIAKVLKIGKSVEGDARGSLRLYGKPATTEFLGIQDIGLLHDGLEDGAEIIWELKKCRQNRARMLVKSKNELMAILKKELRKPSQKRPRETAKGVKGLSTQGTP